MPQRGARGKSRLSEGLVPADGPRVFAGGAMRVVHFFPLVCAASLHAAAPSFPGAEGAGAETTGGRGGSVVHVSNLNASGPGSLADAVSAGDRIVVFDVSGIIDLAPREGGKQKGGRIDITKPNVTILGQTAPGEGICIKGGCLTISADNVIVRHIRSRRGWNSEGDTGDAIEVKPLTTGEKTTGNGQTQEALDKRAAKKAARGKFVHAFASLKNIVIDHCSTSWATDENLTMTHADRTTLSWSIAAEGCDYPNPKQTPPHHSEGSLWGSETPDGRATLHHVLYAHNRLRNPRTTGGGDRPPVLTFYNNIVYDWSEYASHTGSERVLLNWLNSTYKPGPSTPSEVRAHMFEFHGDAGARIFARGNAIAGASEATADNKHAIFHNEKFREMPVAEREAMKADAPFGELPAHVEAAEESFDAVLADAGATLPARDAVDLRIARSVRDGTGRIIEKETDLPEGQRWPDYRSLPAPEDSDHDGLPDFWEKQFGFDPHDASDSATIAAGGYAAIEHYANSTHPRGGSEAVVLIAATVSRASASERGEWRVTRTGDLAAPLAVRYAVSGAVEACEPLTGSVTIPAGAASATIALRPKSGSHGTVVAALARDAADFRAGCPSESLIIIER